MTTEQSWANAMRAEALAKLYLTRTSDLEVLPVSRYSSGPGYDLLVRVKVNDGLKKPEFGVEAKGTRQPLHKSHLHSLLRQGMKEVEASDLPVCLFVFNVDTEKGVYRWMNEPIFVGSDEQEMPEGFHDWWPETHRQNGIGTEVGFEVLDDEAVRRIILRVMQWYKAKDHATKVASASE